MERTRFAVDYERIWRGQATDEEIARTKEFLTTLTSRQERVVKEYFKKNLETLAKIENVELFTLLLERFVAWDYQLTKVLEALMYTANREEHYLIAREKIEDYMVDAKYYADLVGTDLRDLALQALTELTNGKKEVRVYIASYASLEEVLRYGFIPSYEVYHEEDIEITLENPNTSTETLKFFHNKISLRNDFRMFVMLTEQAAKELQTIHDSTTAMLRWAYSHLLYSSQRIRTDMSMFRTPFSNTGVVRDGTLQTVYGTYQVLIPNQGVPQELQGKYCLPVIRYASSLTGGKYHDEPDKVYCGTFYYYEPQAITQLLGERILVTETKYSATKYLLEKYEVPEELATDAQEALHNQFDGTLGALFRDWEERKLRPDLLYTCQELYDENMHWNLADSYYPGDVDDTVFYCGKVLDLYAAEDPFDQILCLLAKVVGVDLVVLTRMVGAKQIVVEVLDARSREDSFKNLVFVKNA